MYSRPVSFLKSERTVASTDFARLRIRSDAKKPYHSKITVNKMTRNSVRLHSRDPESRARELYMSSTHLSRVISPTLKLTPSLFAVRGAPLSDVGVSGVAGAPLDSAIEAFRGAVTIEGHYERIVLKRISDALVVFTVGVELLLLTPLALPCCCFSRSTSVFHFLTNSFARSATCFDAC